MRAKRPELHRRRLACRKTLASKQRASGPKTAYSQYACSAGRLLSRPKIKQKKPRPGRISSNKSGPCARTARGDRFRSRKQEDRPLKTRRPAPPGAGAARAWARAELKKRAQGAQRVNPLLRARPPDPAPARRKVPFPPRPGAVRRRTDASVSDFGVPGAALARRPSSKQGVRFFVRARLIKLLETPLNR